MKNYEALYIELVLFEGDIVTFSSSESADDTGRWNNDWFTTND